MRSPRTLLLLAGTALSVVPAPLGAQTTAATPQAQAPASRLNTSGQPIDLVVPLRERVPLGQVSVRIAPDDRVTVSKADLGAALARVTTEPFRAALGAVQDQDGFIPLDALKEQGLQLSFDPGALELSALLETRNRPEQSLDLGLGGDSLPPEPDRGAGFSALLAYQGSWDWLHRGSDEGLRRPVANFELNGRAFRLFSFQNQFTFDGNNEREWSRFASRAFYDVPGSMLRFSAGDLFTIPQTFQDQVELAGVGVSRLLREFRPDRVFTATAGQRITLNDPATVTILLNGAPARTLSLQAGSYDLRDLPLTGGANRVELLIEDPAGGRRIVSFDFFQDSELLTPGVFEYDARLGIRSDYRDGRRTYDRGVPVATGFIRRGINDQLTAGTSFQATRRRQQVGVDGVFGTALGLFSGDFAVSRMEDFGAGYAARLQYRYSTPLQQLSGARRLDMLVEYLSRDFGGVETEIPSNSTAWSLAARYSQPVTDRLALGGGIDYRVGRDNIRNRYALQTNASYSFVNGMQLNASAGYEQRQGFHVGFNLFWRLGRSGLVTAQYDSRARDTRVGYFHSPERLLDTLAWSVESARVEGAYGLNGTAVWRTNRGDVELAHRAIVAGVEGDARTMVTSLRTRGAVGFAGGKVAAGRFMTDSFAIVSPHSSLGDARVYVGSDVAELAEAHSGPLGPALVPLSSYSRRNVYMAVPGAPDGYDIGAGNVELYPWLHSGHRATVGSAFNVTVFGQLLNQDGEPLALIAGTAHRIDDSTAPTAPVFTNRQGRIGASGLSPGRWRIDAGQYSYELTIPEAQSLFDVGMLRPSGRRENR